jgi:hypothetical protein
MINIKIPAGFDQMGCGREGKETKEEIINI